MKNLNDFALFFIMNIWLSGGTERVFENIVIALKKKYPACKIFLYLLDGIDEQKYKIPDDVFLVRSFTEILSEKKKNPFHIGINFSGYWKSGLITRLFFRDYISWCHNNPLVLKAAKTGFLNLYLLKKSKILVCICKEMIDIFRSFNFKTEIELIYNAIDENVINAKLKENEKLPDFNYILMPARLELQQKDFFCLVDAYKKLDEKTRSEYKLVLLGDGPNKTEIEDYIRKKRLADNVILPGYSRNPYVWMKNASVTILCSKYEGFPLVVIENMYCETPTILTEYKTGALEISDKGNNAALVPVGDSERLAYTMTFLLKDENERNHLKINAKRFVSENFMSELFNEKIIRLFERCGNDFLNKII